MAVLSVDRAVYEESFEIAIGSFGFPTLYAYSPIQTVGGWVVCSGVFWCDNVDAGICPMLERLSLHGNHRHL